MLDYIPGLACVYTDGDKTPFLLNSYSKMFHQNLKLWKQKCEIVMVCLSVWYLKPDYLIVKLQNNNVSELCVPDDEHVPHDDVLQVHEQRPARVVQQNQQTILHRDEQEKTNCRVGSPVEKQRCCSKTFFFHRLELFGRVESSSSSKKVFNTMRSYFLL